MKPSDLKKLLHQLNSFDLLWVYAFVLSRWLRFKLSRLHPSNLLVPVTLAQIAFFILATLYSRNLIPVLAVGNFIIVGFALLPLNYKQSVKITAHWIRKV